MASREEVLRIARLARIRIPESEVENIQKKFSAVLESFHFLAEADTDGIQPLYHAADKLEMRPDVAEAPIARECLLANAPEQFENCFRIPRVVGAEE